MPFLKKAMMGASLLALTSSLFALVPSVATNNYVGGNVGFLKVITVGSDLGSLQNKFPLTYSAYIGHKLSSYFGLEGGYGYSSIKATDSNDQATFKFPYLTTRISVPLAGRADIYGKLGVAYVSVNSKTSPDANGSHPIPYMGIGADINIMPHLAVNVDASGPTIGVIGLYAVSGGLVLKF